MVKLNKLLVVTSTIMCVKEYIYITLRVNLCVQSHNIAEFINVLCVIYIYSICRREELSLVCVQFLYQDKCVDFGLLDSVVIYASNSLKSKLAATHRSQTHTIHSPEKKRKNIKTHLYQCVLKFGLSNKWPRF